MKKILLSLFAVALSVATVFAQAPEKMNYQGVARDNAGNVLPNQSLGLQIKLRSGSSGGAVVYQEAHSASTNAFGLFNVQIGGGSVESGTFSSIAWGTTTYYVEVLMDASGGTSYTSMGTQQLVSVPYALNAKASETTAAVSGTTNYIPKFTSANTLGNSAIFQSGTNIGIGTTAPTAALSVYSSSIFPLKLMAAQDPLIVIDEAGTSKAFIQDYADELWISTYDAQPFHLGTNSAERLTIGATGNVGIGTTAPASFFHVKTTGSEMARFESTTASKWIGFYESGTRKGMLWNNTNDITLRADDASGNLHFQTAGNNTRMTVTSTGNVGIGTTAPASTVHVLHGQGIPDNGLTLENINYSWWSLYTSSGSDLWLNSELSAHIGTFDDITGAYTTVSDKRMKKNIEPMGTVLGNVLQLQPKQYHFIRNTDADVKSLGFIAQEAKVLFPSLVKENEEDGLLTMDYAGFSIVAIKAIQEQQELIKKLEQRIKVLEAK